MEDDIDIEEHDVLDNPRIRTIFPDLAQIKKEIPDDDYHDPDQEMDYIYPEEDNSNQDYAAEYSQVGSKIILGSKPNHHQLNKKADTNDSIPVFGRKSIEIKQEVEEFDETDHLHNEEEYHPSTVLILGSKPSNTGVIEPIRVSDVNSEHVKSKAHGFRLEFEDNAKNNDIDEDREKDPTAAFVLAEDWGPRLKNSPCFCKECEILFSTRNTLLAHNMTAHSFLVAVDKNKAKKSTSKPNETGKFCNHCNKIFPDSDSLINHLYETLTFDKNNATFKAQSKKVANPFNKVNVHGVSKASSSNDGSKVEANMYRCVVCSFYCEIYGFFQKHMQNNHGINTASKEKVVFTGFCLYCNAKMKTKSTYNHHLKLTHVDVFNSRGPFPKAQIAKIVAHKKPEPKPFPKSSNQFSQIPIKIPAQVMKYNQYNSQTFQCQKCSEIFQNYDRARQHRKLKHPELATQNIFKKITNFGNKTVCIQKARVPPKVAMKLPNKPQKPAPQAVPTNSVPSTTKTVVAIPNSHLFKCGKCNIHYTSCTATVLHAKFCANQKGDWNCDICKREFQDFDLTTHKRQHKICDQFNVTIVSSDNVYGRILNKCPKCEAYFHEKDFFIHEQKNVCKGVGVKCEICTYPIHPTSAKSHSKWHERVGFNKKNVIVVEFANLVVEEKVALPVKRPSEPFNSSPAKKAKIEKSSDFNPHKKAYCCHNCGCCMFKIRGPNTLQKHTLGKCKNDKEKKTICKFCGLYGHAKNHLRYHKRNPETTIMDMKFVNLKNKVIFPPIPNFPRCTQCQVHFGKLETVHTHTCDDSYKTCAYCQKRFSDLAYKLHIRFHEYHNKFRRSKGILVNSNSPTESLAKAPKFNVPLPELLQKYEMLTNTWNILFHCETCDIVCGNYDKAVEHSQKHYNNMESYDVIVQHCDICEMNFDGDSFDKHAQLHAQNKSVVKNSFTIQPYKYFHLFSLSWLKQFRKIPQSQLNQILSRSIYRYARSVKLRVVQPGAPENALYRCGKCETYIHPFSLPNHYKNVSCGNNKHLNCAICGLPFNSINGKVYHEKMHKTAKNFMVVCFNEEGDEEFNEKLRQNDHKKRNSHFGPTVPGSNKTYHYYRCVVCKTCIGQKDKAVIHKCCPKFARRCNKCQLQFHAHTFTKHVKLHELNPNFVKKNIKVTSFKNNINTGSFVIVRDEEKPNVKVVKLYKCPCGLHFISTEAADKHLMVCGLDIEIAKENCSQCDRLFDTTQLVTHLCKHHVEDDQPTKFEDVSVTANEDDDQAPVKVAPAENLQKSKAIATPKKFEHQESVKAAPVQQSQRSSAPATTNKAKSQAPVKVQQQMYLRSKSAFRNRKNLYKCPECDVYYLSPGGLAYHFERNHQLSKVLPCPHCNLKFMPQTLKKHIIIQHQNLQYTLEDFVIHIGTMQIDGQLMFAEKKPLEEQPTDELDDSEPSKVDRQDSPSNIDVSTYSENLYKCNVCDAHFMAVYSYYSHLRRNVNPIDHESELVNCSVCNYTFRSKSLLVHLKVHHDAMQLNRNDLKIQVLIPVAKESPRVYGRRKKKLPIDEESVDDSQCSEDITEEENNSSVGDTTSFKSVDIDNTGRGREKETDDVETSIVDDSVKTYKYSSVLYKCGICDWISFTSKIEWHVKAHLEGKTTPPVACWCGLAFSGRSNLLKHEQLHHDKQGLGKDDLYVMTQNVYNDVVGDKHIFKCGVCQVYFPKLTSLENHLAAVGHYTATIDCPECGLAFQSASIKSHKKIHHVNMKLDRKDFIVVESVGKSRVKIVELGEDLRKKVELAEITDNENIKGAKVKIVQLDEGKEQEKPIEIADTQKLAKDLSQTHSNYKATLHKCGLCGTHFLDGLNIALHENACPLETELKAICEKCQLQFSNHNLNKHTKEHHQDMNLKVEDFEIIQYGIKETDFIDKDTTEAEDTVTSSPETEKENIVIKKKEESQKERCNQQLDSPTCEKKEEIDSIDDNALNTDKVPTNDIKNSEIIDETEPVTNNMTNAKDKVTEGPDSLDKHGKLEPEKSVEVQSSSNASANRDSDNVIKLYKCAVCNVCFLSQTSCYRHATKHVTLDSKEYIECKLCGYQFQILSNCLHKHITKHHNKSFKPENVLIEEYHPDILCHGTPKINIYFGTDKLQSKLISTTCEPIVSSTCEPSTSSELQSVDNDIPKGVSSISMDGDKTVNPDDSMSPSVLES